MSDECPIKVNVVSEYLSAESQPEENRYVFAYHVEISNTGDEPAQLISRHWIITDGDEKVQEVKGEGVIGEKPLIKPGDAYQYSSGTILETPVGSMRGSYQMQADDGSYFDAPIPAFTLANPSSLN